MPAMFDGGGNVRIPMRVIVYHKGYSNALGRSQVYPPTAAIIARENLHTVPGSEGGVEPEDAYQCSDQFRGSRFAGTFADATVQRHHQRLTADAAYFSIARCNCSV